MVYNWIVSNNLYIHSFWVAKRAKKGVRKQRVKIPKYLEIT